MQTSISVPIDTFQQWIEYLDGFEVAANITIKAKKDMQDFLDRETYTADDAIAHRQVGTLNRPWGLAGWDRAEIGHPVYEENDCYAIYLTGGVRSPYRVWFRKENLKHLIKFND